MGEDPHEINAPSLSPVHNDNTNRDVTATNRSSMLSRTESPNKLRTFTPSTTKEVEQARADYGKSVEEHECADEEELEEGDEEEAAEEENVEEEEDEENDWSSEGDYNIDDLIDHDLGDDDSSIGDGPKLKKK